MPPPLRLPRVFTTLVPLLFVATACGEIGPTAPATQWARVQPALSVAPTLWSAAGPGTVTLHNDGSTGQPDMQYEFLGSGGGVTTKTWTFSTTAATAGVVTQDYLYFGFHAFFQVSVFVHPFVIHNSIKTYLPGVDLGPVNCCTFPSGGFELPGSTTFNVDAGDTYGFEIGGSNFDFDSRLLGRFIIVLADDATPPVITPDVDGTLGANGWYTSDVTVTWTVTDDESAVSSTSGCEASTLTSDSSGETYTCTATSGGGTSSASVTVKRDATSPVIAFGGNAGTYSVDQTVAITCSATDATSGIASSTCPGASGTAYSFGPGTHTLAASAADNAGNASAASTQFTVTVTSGGLCQLIAGWVNNKGVANSMCKQLQNGAYGAFRNHVSAQSGKSVLAANAATLIALSQSL